MPVVTIQGRTVTDPDPRLYDRPASTRRPLTQQEIRRLGPFLDTDAPSIGRHLGDLYRRGHHLLACPGVDGKPLYPSWQFDEHGQPVQGLSTVLAILLPVADAWTVARWLRTCACELDVDPVTWLAKGRDPAPVFAAARSAATRWHRNQSRSELRAGHPAVPMNG